MQNENTTELGRLLTNLFNKLESENINYCILRNYKDLPNYTNNDIDMMINNKYIDNVIDILIEISNKLNWKVYNIVEHGCIAIYLYKYDEENIVFAHIDLFGSFNWKYCDIISDIDILNNIERYKNFFIPTSEYRLVMLLLGNLLYNKKIKKKYISEINELYLECNKNIVKKILKKALSENNAIHIINCIENLDYENIEKSYDSYKKSLLDKNKTKSKKNYIKKYIQYIKRIIKRVVNPKGKVVGILNYRYFEELKNDTMFNSYLEKIYGQRIYYINTINFNKIVSIKIIIKSILMNKIKNSIIICHFGNKIQTNKYIKNIYFVDSYLENIDVYTNTDDKDKKIISNVVKILES
ncbi:hypothetical protein [Romboutsia timonensis]|uniref:hypothetical protein n=1 Tax=Romboutsia timonensis TaxID=1776391 RepID=UPI002A816E14|nr:hypothetical protein [Romboutsia timonensis]MDY3959070.1 hypothetical protein [Romboutsia timonensis]